MVGYVQMMGMPLGIAFSNHLTLPQVIQISEMLPKGSTNYASPPGTLEKPSDETKDINRSSVAYQAHN